MERTINVVRLKRQFRCIFVLSQTTHLKCSEKKVLLDCNFIKKEALAQTFSYEFCEISKNTFFHRTPLAAASVTLSPISKFKFFLFMALPRGFTTEFDMMVLSTSIISNLTWE